MAGEVRCDVFHVPHAGRMDLVARTCPVSEQYGEICIKYDEHTGEAQLCPFWYGLHIWAGRQHYGEARCIHEIRDWLATDGYPSDRNYTVRCLRASSGATRPGAGR